MKKAKSHPSYGLVSFHRVSCGGNKEKLFGSSILHHFTMVRLTIHEAELTHDLCYDSIFPRKQIVEVDLSAAQFAELLTTMNQGSGVPCTIRWREGVGEVEPPPDNEIEIDRVHESFKANMAERVEWLSERREELAGILEKKAIGKQDRLKISRIIEGVIAEFRSSAPFAVDQFSEATEKIVTAAKAEVDSFVTQVIQVTGLEQLRAMKGGEVIDTKALPSAKKEDEDDGSGFG